MFQDSTTWQDYQSLIQLGAGLNFAYAALDGILSDVSNVATRERRLLIAKIPKTVPDTFFKNNVRAVDFRKMRNCLDFILCIFRIHRVINPYLSLVCGCVAIYFLAHASEHGRDLIERGDRILTLSVCFGWVGLSVIVLGALRMRLTCAIIPFFKRVA